MELKGLSMGFPPVYSFLGIFPTVLAQIGFELWEKLLSQHFFGTFLSMSRQFSAKTVGNNPRKLYTGGKPIGRPFNSIKAKPKILL